MMIDPALQDLEGGDVDDNHEPKCPGLLLSDRHGVQDKSSLIEEEAAELQKQVNAHSTAIQDIHKKLLLQKSASAAFKNLAKNQLKSRTVWSVFLYFWREKLKISSFITQPLKIWSKKPQKWNFWTK